MAAERELESASPEATEALAEALGRALVAGDVVALEGELGSGKTCFVRGLARGLGIEAPVTSPTYTLMQRYDEEDGARVPLEHYDAYMEGRERAFLLDGGLDGLGGEAVSVVEWAERVADLLPAPRLVVRLAHGSAPDRRRLRLAVVGTGPRAEALAGLLEALEAPEWLRGGLGRPAGGREGFRRLSAVPVNRPVFRALGGGGEGDLGRRVGPARGASRR